MRHLIPLTEAIKLVSVTNLRFIPSNRDPVRGLPVGRWLFDVTTDHETASYYTSDAGDGLWLELGCGMADDRQVEGCCQFDLSGCTRRGAYDRIRAHFARGLR